IPLVFLAATACQARQGRPKRTGWEQKKEENDQQQCGDRANQRGVVRFGAQQNRNAVGYRQNPFRNSIKHQLLRISLNIKNERSLRVSSMAPCPARFRWLS